MPKIKGWEKIDAEPNLHHWQSENKRMGHYGNAGRHTSVMVANDPKARAKDWEVSIHRTAEHAFRSQYDDSIETIEKEFPTKNAALTFARKWMKDHPEG